MDKVISVIIPTLNAGNDICILLSVLYKQNVKPAEIIIIDSESDDNTLDLVKQYAEVRIIQIKRKDFDHGRTRDKALRESKGNVIVFLTQDAIPANEEFLAELIDPLQDETVALCTGRQLPKEDASRMEKLIRAFNYPDSSQTKQKKDIDRLGIKTFFCSDVCAAYNREIYLSLGGFEYPLRTNEDMLYAAKAIQSGYKIVYNAQAQVYHSHNLTLCEQYRRNFEQGFEIEKHQELLANVSQETEGMKLVKFVSVELLKRGHFISFIHFGLDCVARLLGNRAGRKAYHHT